MNLREIINDLARRYGETYLWVKMPDSESKALCWCSGIVATAKGGEIHLTSNEYGKLVLNINTNHELLFNQPRVGVFQHGREAYVHRRLPQRQYRRGLCGQNATISSVVRGALSLAGNSLRDGVDLDLVQAAYDGQTYDAKAALGMLTNGKARSVALANDFSVSLNTSMDKDLYIVFYMDSPIAYLSTEGKLVKVLESVFVEELQEMFG